MKKYIIGLMSAICLMGAGCTEFEDYKSADLGEGPAIEVSMDTVANSVGAFTVKIKPAEGTVYYAYLLTTQELSADASTLLQGDYENAVVLNYEEQDSVEISMTNQKLAQTYYTYAVASNHQGLCGAVKAVSLFLPDREAPYLVNVPSGQLLYKYTATNQGRSIVLEFNEPIVRGEGAITYVMLRADGMTQYGEGTIDDVVINNDRATISLPESAQFDENEAFSYVFLDFAAGAFTDASGNPSSALVGGLDEDGFINAPWWEYKPGAPEPSQGMVGTYGFLFIPYDFENQKPGAQEDMLAFDTEFSLKYANRTDTVIIDKFYFADDNMNKLEAGMYDSGFSIADFQPMAIATMQDNTGAKVNVIILFAGNANSENEQFTEVKFEETTLSDGSVAYVADRYCGIYLLDYDVLSAGGSMSQANLGWYDLWAPAFFIEGSAFESSAAPAPMANTLKAKYSIKSRRPLQYGEMSILKSKKNDFKKIVRR